MYEPTDSISYSAAFEGNVINMHAIITAACLMMVLMGIMNSILVCFLLGEWT